MMQCRGIRSRNMLHISMLTSWSEFGAWCARSIINYRKVKQWPFLVFLNNANSQLNDAFDHHPVREHMARLQQSPALIHLVRHHSSLG